MPNISTNTMSISSANFLLTKNISTANITHIPNQELGRSLTIRLLYRRNAKCRKISFSPFTEWAGTNQLKLFLGRMEMLTLSQINKITKVSKHLQQGKIDQAKANRDALTRELARIQDALKQAQTELDKAIEEQAAFEKMLEELGV